MIEKEWSFFERLIDQVDDDGKKCGYLEEGQSIHQAVLSSSHQYMLHYKFEANCDDTMVLFLPLK
jgi:hypothetical protein